jgi:hypothetical protein
MKYREIVMTDLYEKCISMNPLSYALRSSFSMYISNKVHPTLKFKTTNARFN